MRWPIGWRRISIFSINRIRIGSAVTAQAMPMPVTNCQSRALAPIQPGEPSMPIAARAPNSSGTPRARPAVTPLSKRCSQALRRSSSMPAIQTKTITAHQAMPFSAWITGGAKTKR